MVLPTMHMWPPHRWQVRASMLHFCREQLRPVQALPPPAIETPVTREAPLAVAIVGRPNVGKSSLVNALTGMGRAIVSDLSGTTHDAIDTELTLPDGTPVTLIDTAGIRKRGRVAESSDGAEKLSVARAIRAMRRTDVVAILLDSVQGITSQDIRRAAPRSWDMR